MVYTGINNQLLGTDNLATLTSGQIDSLDIGNTVVLDVNGEQKTFFVSKKTASEFCMIHTGKDKIIEVAYEWQDGAWAYDSTTEADIEDKLEMYELKATDFTVDVETGIITATAEFLEIAKSGKYYIKADASLLGGEGIGYYYPNANADNAYAYSSVYGDVVDTIVVRSNGIIDKFTQHLAYVEPYTPVEGDTVITGLSINDLHYALSSGTKLYKHSVQRQGSTITLISYVGTPITTQIGLRDFLKDDMLTGYDGNSKRIIGYWTHPTVPSNGLGVYSIGGTTTTVPTEPQFSVVDLTNWVDDSFTDTVTEL